jgi:hypothetical protein
MHTVFPFSTGCWPVACLASPVPNPESIRDFGISGVKRHVSEKNKMVISKAEVAYINDTRAITEISVYI